MYNVKRWRFISRTAATATVRSWRKMGSVGNCSGVLKRSATTGNINVLTTNHTTTHRRNDELRNMFFKNNPGKVASLKNYNEARRNQTSASWYDVTVDDDFRKLPKNNYTKKTIKLLPFSILRCNSLKFITQTLSASLVYRRQLEGG